MKVSCQPITLQNKFYSHLCNATPILGRRRQQNRIIKMSSYVEVVIDCTLYPKKSTHTTPKNFKIKVKNHVMSHHKRTSEIIKIAFIQPPTKSLLSRKSEKVRG